MARRKEETKMKRENERKMGREEKGRGTGGRKKRETERKVGGKVREGEGMEDEDGREGEVDMVSSREI